MPDETIVGMTDEELGLTPPDHPDFRLLQSLSRELDDSMLNMPEFARAEKLDPASLAWAGISAVASFRDATKLPASLNVPLFQIWQSGFAIGVLYARNHTN